MDISNDSDWFWHGGWYFGLFWMNIADYAGKCGDSAVNQSDLRELCVIQ